MIRFNCWITFWNHCENPPIFESNHTFSALHPIAQTPRRNLQTLQQIWNYFHREKWKVKTLGYWQTKSLSHPTLRNTIPQNIREVSSDPTVNYQIERNIVFNKSQCQFENSFLFTWSELNEINRRHRIRHVQRRTTKWLPSIITLWQRKTNSPLLFGNVRKSSRIFHLLLLNVGLDL